MLTHIETTNADTTVSVNSYGLDHLELSYRDYLFSFEFAALNFTNAARNRYAYRLLEAAPADLVGFLRRVVSAFTSLAQRRSIDLAFKTDTPRIGLYFNAEKLEQVVTNLLSNAFKFTEEGGRITVSVEDAEAEADERGTGSFVAVHVADTGLGIPAAQVPHVFDRFYQADPSLTRRHEGTGIGLALVREFVALHGGGVSVESTEGVGTTFTVLLPKGTDHLAEEEIVWERERGERERGRRSRIED